MNKSTLRDRIRLALLRLQENEANYPHRINNNGDPLPQCHFCREVGLFVTGNGSIPHTNECAVVLIHRISKHSDLVFFDQLAWKSVLHQIANMTRWPRKPVAGHMDWQYFCPFCKCLMQVSKQEHEDGSSTTTYTMPHNKNCIVTLAKAELEQQQGGQA